MSRGIKTSWIFFLVASGFFPSRSLLDIRHVTWQRERKSDRQRFGPFISNIFYKRVLKETSEGEIFPGAVISTSVFSEGYSRGKSSITGFLEGFTGQSFKSLLHFARFGVNSLFHRGGRLFHIQSRHNSINSKHYRHARKERTKVTNHLWLSKIQLFRSDVFFLQHTQSTLNFCICRGIFGLLGIWIFTFCHILRLL